MRKTKRKSSGKRTRGWRRTAPTKGTERHSMRKRCARKCFLMPKQEKFPICTHGTCKINCKGLVSAKVRARQYKYTKLLPKIERLSKRHCA